LEEEPATSPQISAATAVAQARTGVSRAAQPTLFGQASANGHRSTKVDHDKERETLARDRFAKPPAAVEIGGDETGANTGVNPGEEPIMPRDAQTPVGNDPAQPGGGHGEGP
jgi:hypothetical protein